MTETIEITPAALVADLPLAERIRLVSGRDFWTTHDVPGRIPSVMLTDGPNGLRKQAESYDHVGMADSIPATCFPATATLGATWDPELIEEVGQAIGREARAEDVAVLLGPGLNIKRHPRSGRNFEYFSEDPLLSGKLAAAMVRGVQREGVAACPKHFAANNQEANRMVVDTIIDERTLREIYLRGFEIVVDESDPWALMTAYNQVNGSYCSDHQHLLGEVLRGEWGFNGLVVSDWGGTNDRVAALRAGLDLEMPGGGGAFDPEIAAAIDTGALLVSDLDAAAARVAGLALRWDQVRGGSVAVDQAAHHELARRAAVAGTTLLRNDGILPLVGEGSIVVIGAFAKEPRYQGAGSAKVNPTRLDNLYDALLEQRPDLDYVEGYEAKTGSVSAEQQTAATDAARAAETVVLVVRLPAGAETETLDRPDAALPADLNELVEAVLDANPRTVVVLMNGGSLELPWADRPAAIVEAYLGGQAGGQALADVLTDVAEPGGRLAESFPFEVTDLAADANFPGHPRQVEYREGFHVGYRFHDSAGVPARFPFGHGLGYTTFEFGPPQVTGSGTDLRVEVPVTNTGERAGSTVVQVYLRDVASTVARPEKELVGFAKVTLAPGESGSAVVTLNRRSFAIWDVAAHEWLVEAGEFEILVGASSADIRGRVTVVVESQDCVQPSAQTAGAVATDTEFAALLGRPIPVPAAVRPFTRTSTIADLEHSLIGRQLAKLMRTAAKRQFSSDDEESVAFIDNVLSNMPLRGFAMMGGPVSLATLDRIIAGLNGDLRSALLPRRWFARG